MSFLVAIARSAYRADALNAFHPTSAFSLHNAQAMMWMSQLAYETDKKKKIESVLGDWSFALRGFASNDPGTGWPPKSACMVAGGGRGATIIGFAGSDPLKFEDWITDFNAKPSPDDVHTGFQKAVNTVWPEIKRVIDARPAPEQPLFFTGHSLGGALAIVAAERALSEAKVGATAVYTFGSPRTGGPGFFADYLPSLANATYRLVDGTDVVPTVPTPLRDTFLHVGQMIQCPTDGIFVEPPVMSATNSNAPDLVDGLLQSGLSDLRALSAFRLIRFIGPRPLDMLSSALPRIVRDHVPANYFRALSIPLQ
jgi:triacylglycerol lipase